MSTSATATGHPARLDSAGGLHLFDAPDFDFAARTALGHAAQGTLDAGLVLSTLSRIADGDPDGWYTAWHGVATDLAAEAERRRADGHLASAGRLFLAASEAYDQALTFVDGMPDDAVLLPTFRQHRTAWDAFIDASAGAHLPLTVTCDDGSMPGYLLRPDATGNRRPTLVVTNGSDGSLTGLWATCAANALSRGWNAYVFDGPGQQSMLFEHGIPFRHDWEAVLTPVLDELLGRDDVDPDGLLGYGISQGGYWLPRALAFEHRMRAAVVDGGVVDVARAWNAHLPAALLDLLRSEQADTFNQYMSVPSDPQTERTFAFRARPFGADKTPYELFTEVNRYRLDGLTERITTPLLITDPQDEQFFPGQPQELYDALGCEKRLVTYTADQGAAQHCEPLARGRVALDMSDWFADHLRRGRPRPADDSAPRTP